MRRLTYLFGVLALGLSACVPPADPLGPAYAIETIPMPDGLVAETGGLEFLPDGRLVASFHRGEILIYDPETQAWSTFADGLHDGLGILPEPSGSVLVMQRPELTRLTDTDADGRADLFETVTDDFGMSGNYHEFAFGPVRDADGALYLSLGTASNGDGVRDLKRGLFNPLGRPGRMYSSVPYRGYVMRLAPDGTLEPFAHGFRTPNGLGFDLEGRLFVTDNQGDWLGTSPLYHVEEGNFYGHVTSLVWEPGFDIDPLTLPVDSLDAMRTPPVVQFPHGILANSPTQPIVVADDRFGPFKGQLIVGEMNFPRLLRVMLEEVGGALQGAATTLIDTTALRMGNNRLAFAPDGSLWVGQNDHGWVGDRGIQRVAWTGTLPMDLHTMHLTETGFDLSFTLPLDAATVATDSALTVTRYRYAYHRAYGSPQLDVTAVTVTDWRTSDDARTLSLDLSELVPGFVYQIDFAGLRANTGRPLDNPHVYYTLNRLR
ncbi:MAG: hypothetical protein RhofKO_25320 [Rhodothermales bacterium]